MFNSDNNGECKDCKDDCEDIFKKERKCKDDGCFVSVNIYCDKSKKELKFKEDECECDCDCKKENKCKDDECFVCVNVFCDKCKKDHEWKS